jgi:hypothetical protein
MNDRFDVSAGTPGSTRPGADRRLTILWAGLILYCLIFLSSLRYLQHLPYQASIAVGILNLAIMTGFGLAIRGVLRRRRDRADERAVSADPSRNEADHRRLKILWGGLILYGLIFLNGFRYLERLPYQALIAGGVVNLAIITVILLEIRRISKKPSL